MRTPLYRRVCVLAVLGVALVATPVAVRSARFHPRDRALPEASPRAPYQVGIASWYGAYFQGRETTSGERFNMYAMTAAHRELPLGTRVRVTNLENGRSVVLRINDRGPVPKSRVIDVSYAAAGALRFRVEGLVPVRIEVLRTMPATLGAEIARR
ncbi:MAG: septal ring lytic transglycosylase RlpA family protein [Terriglobales bacterium]